MKICPCMLQGYQSNAILYIYIYTLYLVHERFFARWQMNINFLCARSQKWDLQLSGQLELQLMAWQKKFHSIRNVMVFIQKRDASDSPPAIHSLNKLFYLSYCKIQDVSDVDWQVENYSFPHSKEEKICYDNRPNGYRTKHLNPRNNSSLLF